MRHVKTSEAYQLDKKRKFFPFLSINLFLQQHETQQESFLKKHQIMEKNYHNILKPTYHDNIYNSIFSMLVLIPTSKLFTTYCNRKQIHCLFYFLVSAL